MAVPAWFVLCLQIYVKDFQGCFWSGKIAFQVSDGAGLGGTGPASRQAGLVCPKHPRAGSWRQVGGSLRAKGREGEAAASPGVPLVLLRAVLPGSEHLAAAPSSRLLPIWLRVRCCGG